MKFEKEIAYKVILGIFACIILNGFIFYNKQSIHAAPFKGLTKKLSAVKKTVTKTVSGGIDKVKTNISSARNKFMNKVKNIQRSLSIKAKKLNKEISKNFKSIDKPLKSIESSIEKSLSDIKTSLQETKKTITSTISLIKDLIELSIKGRLTGEIAFDRIAIFINEVRDSSSTAVIKLISGSTKPIRDVLQFALHTVKEAPLTEGIRKGALNRFGLMEVECKAVKVRESSDPISEGEKNFRKKRDIKVKNAQKEIFDINDPLMITASGSGGGLRATLGYMGHMLGLKESGLLDTITYSSGLSGGTWFLSSWMQQDKSLEEIKEFLVNRISGHENVLSRAQEIAKLSLNKEKIEAIKDIFKTAPGLLKSIIDNLVVKWAFAEPYNIVDLYGSILGWLFLPHSKKDNEVQRQYLSEQIEQIKNGQNPMPIYTAQWYQGGDIKRIIEFNPYEIGDRKSFVNSDGFGREYINGKSDNCAPPQNLGYLQGIWGSAFAARVKDIWDFMLKEKIEQILDKLAPGYGEKLNKPIDQLIERAKVGKDFQFAKGAYINNFTKDIEEGISIPLIDLGIGWMMNPIFSLYRDDNGQKAPNVIFVFDYQIEPSGNQELSKIKQTYLKEFNIFNEYAKNNNLKLPNMNVEDLAVTEDNKLKTMTVFKDNDDSSKPVILFFPLVSTNLSFKNYDTFKFNYSKDEAEALINLTKNNLLENVNEIKDIIKNINK